MMKTPLILCVLFSTFGIAGSKTTGSKTPAPTVTAVCTTDCLVTGSGYTAGKSYTLEIADNANGAVTYHSFTAPSAGTFSYTVTNPSPGVWSFYVFTVGSSGSLLKLVASTSDVVQ